MSGDNSGIGATHTLDEALHTKDVSRGTPGSEVLEATTAHPRSAVQRGLRHRRAPRCPGDRAVQRLWLRRLATASWMRLLLGTVALAVTVVMTDAALAGAGRDLTPPAVMALLAAPATGTGPARAHVHLLAVLTEADWERLIRRWNFAARLALVRRTKSLAP